MRNALRTLALGALVAAPLLAMSAPAHALTNVTSSGGQLSVNSANVSDDISISVESGFLVVRNNRDTLITAGVCQQVDTNTVRCPSGGVTNIVANLQGGNDILSNNTALPSRVFMGPGVDTFFGGPGKDFVSGNDNDDVLHGRGGNDILVGNAGFDQGFGGADNDFCDTETLNSCEDS
ncbi:calcium-binding protein [Planomonospora sphaerica]|uniref:Calcium-binding protein n=1 Tax=Planomonospora sphaerica TaxID=161355 RepID=A0A161LPF0_9ACTN|nr:hypothetical protein [Planomonospora sphaerica]GAT69915.1 calcium-binding protein [Planomonospora sphaerica]